MLIILNLRAWKFEISMTGKFYNFDLIQVMVFDILKIVLKVKLPELNGFVFVSFHFEIVNKRRIVNGDDFNLNFCWIAWKNSSTRPSSFKTSISKPILHRFVRQISNGRNSDFLILRNRQVSQLENPVSWKLRNFNFL